MTAKLTNRGNFNRGRLFNMEWPLTHDEQLVVDYTKSNVWRSNQFWSKGKSDKVIFRLSIESGYGFAGINLETQFLKHEIYFERKFL